MRLQRLVLTTLALSFLALAARRVSVSYDYVSTATGQQYKEREPASKEVRVMMSIPIPKPSRSDDDDVEEVVLDRMQIKVIAWRTEELEKAGWSNAAADQIARIGVQDLVEMGYSSDQADIRYPDYWRLAKKAIACGDEARALYLIGLTSER